MSTLNLRKRNPFKFTTAIPELDDETSDRILDEQEQEQIIDSLTEEKARLTEMYAYLGIVALALSSLVQILSIFSILRDSNNKSSKIFALFNLALHAHAYFVIRDARYRHGAVYNVPDFLPLQLLCLLQPGVTLYFHPENLSILTFVSLFITLVAGISVSSIKNSEHELIRLEGLTYRAKGA